MCWWLVVICVVIACDLFLICWWFLVVLVVVTCDVVHLLVVGCDFGSDDL
jgi:hypothetical protein